LLAALEKRLAKGHKDAGLLELRAELAGQESDFERQAADCTTAIKMLAEQPAAAVAAPLRRLYRLRGDAYVSMQKWSEAVADFARRLAVGGQAPLATAQFEKSRALYERALEADPDNDLVVPELAQLLWDKHEKEIPIPWTVLKPVEAQSQLGATLSILPGSSI